MYTAYDHMAYRYSHRISTNTTKKFVTLRGLLPYLTWNTGV